MTITSSGMTTIEDTITLTTKEEYKYDVRLEKSPVFDKIGKIIDTDMTLIDGIVENANMYFTGSFISIGQIPSGKIYAIRKSEEGSDIGILTLERFSPLFSLPFFVESASLDRSRQFLILRRDATESFLISLDGTLSVSFPFPDAVEIVQNISNTWKVLTRDGVMTLSSLGWEKNPRFRDYIDISPEYRLGYLSKDDKEKKSLQNIDSAESLFLLLDRKSTIVRTIEKGREIIGFISYE